MAIEDARPSFVVGDVVSVLAAVQLDREFQFSAKEVGMKAGNGDLGDELQVAELAAAEAEPEEVFDLVPISAEFASTFGRPAGAEGTSLYGIASDWRRALPSVPSRRREGKR